MSLLKLGMKDHKPVVVMEIGNDWLKIVEGHAAGSGIVMTKASFRKISQISEPMQETIAKIFKELKLHKKHVISYIPRHLITVRILELPSTNIREIDPMIKLQIGKQTPYSKDEIVYSYKIIDSFREGYTKVMLVIATRNIVNERLGVLKKAGIEVQSMTLSSEGVSHWIQSSYLSRVRSDETQAIAVVDIDSNFSDFMVYQKGRLIFTKNILIGANHLENKIDAQQEKFIDELNHSYNLFSEEWKNFTVVKLMLTGAVQGVSDSLDVMKTRLNLPCETHNTFGDLKMKNKGSLVEESRLKVVSCSAALGFFIKPKELDFNLLLQEVRVQKVMEDKRKSLSVVGILFGAVILALSLLILIHVNNKNGKLAQIKQQATRLKDVSKNVEKMRLLIHLFQNRLDARGDTLNILNDIYTVMPDKVYLTEINIQRKGAVAIKGKAIAMSEVFKLVNLLENIPSLESVQNTYATMNKENKDGYSTDFEITAVYSGPMDQ